MAKKTKITVHPAYPIGEISPRLYGAFLEPIGTLVNGMMYSPKHPTADDKGFRGDIIEALRKTDLPCVRLPGGNFVSGWDWRDSIGPKEQRRVHLDLAWHQYITNDVGHDEYLQWTERIGAEPMYTLNLGTAGINEAIYNVEYTNHKGGTYWSDLRIKNGHKEPYGVKIWYLGNEPDGPWQIGSWERDPTGFGVLTNEVSKAIKWVDGNIETVAGVSCSPNMSHYPDWDLKVLQECYNSVDYISLHHYHSVRAGDLATFMGALRYFEDYINTEVALCDFVQVKMRSPRKLMISFDEYAIMMRQPSENLHYGRAPYENYRAHYRFSPYRDFVLHDPDNMWRPREGGGAPRRRPYGDMLGALGNASVLLAFIRHADRVKIGCMTGGLGVLATANRDQIWRTASYYPYTQLMRYGRGISMRCSVEGDTYDIPSYIVDDINEYYEQEGVDYIDAAAAFDDNAGELNVFLINRDWESDRTIELDATGFKGYKFCEHIQLYSDDLSVVSTPENPDAIVPTINNSTKEDEDGIIKADLKKLSWNILRFVKVNESDKA